MSRCDARWPAPSAGAPPADAAARDAAVVRLDRLAVDAGGRTLLQVDSLAIHEGERVAFVGPNGAGKTTLLRVLGGFARATRGSVTVLGRRFGPDAGTPALDRAGWRTLRAEVGQVMQGLHLVPRLSARDNVVLGALARPRALPAWRSWTRLYPPALVREADAALAALGLDALAGARADRLSGGERQKTAIARLALQRPRLILADEPTAALDPAAAEQACAALDAAAASATLVVVVHDLRLLPRLADRVIGLAEGRVRFDLPCQALDDARLRALYHSAPAAADASCAGSYDAPAAPVRAGESYATAIAAPALRPTRQRAVARRATAFPSAGRP